MPLLLTGRGFRQELERAGALALYAPLWMTQRSWGTMAAFGSLQPTHPHEQLLASRRPGQRGLNRPWLG